MDDQCGFVIRPAGYKSSPYVVEYPRALEGEICKEHSLPTYVGMQSLLDNVSKILCFYFSERPSAI